MTIDRMIELLKTEHECMLRNSHGSCNRECADCDLVQDDSELHEMYSDVIAMLVAQEPRVMTLEEVNAFDWDYCYLEEERLPGKEYRGILGKHILTCVTWPSITASKITYGMDSYGRKWRCWTDRPSDTQRKAEPWK